MKSGTFAKIGAGVLMAALFTGAAADSAPSGQSLNLHLAVAPEVMAFDEGIEVRDAQGRVVSSAAANRQLRQLFVSSLFVLLMRPELPAMAEALSVLQKTWNLASGVLGRAAAVYWTFAMDVWAPAVKRWKAIPSLCLFAVLGLVFAQGFFVLRSAPRTESHLKTLATTLLRC